MVVISRDPSMPLPAMWSGTAGRGCPSFEHVHNPVSRSVLWQYHTQGQADSQDLSHQQFHLCKMSAWICRWKGWWRVLEVLNEKPQLKTVFLKAGPISSRFVLFFFCHCAVFCPIYWLDYQIWTRSSIICYVSLCSLVVITWCHITVTLPSYERWDLVQREAKPCSRYRNAWFR